MRKLNVLDMDLIEEMLRNTKTIAVIGAKPLCNQPAYTVPYYMYAKGYKIYPVNPLRVGQEEFDQKFVDKVYNVPVNTEMVNIFRRSELLEGHAVEILAMPELPKYVWIQLGLWNDKAAALLEKAGIKVIQNKCIMIEHSKYF